MLKHPQKQEGALYPSLSASLREELSKIEPSYVGKIKYCPCAVKLRDGSERDCVYLIEQYSYISVWGVYPEDDPGKGWIPVDEVLSVRSSLSRLPAKFATKLYEGGESGMGFVVFTVRFSDGSQQAYVAGNAADFIRYPNEKKADDVVDVLPHVGRDTKPVQVPEHFWCLYSDENTKRAYESGLTKPLEMQQRSLWARLRDERSGS
jgi:hypothetical protein